MKRTISLLVIALLVVGLFAGCANTQAPAPTPAPSQPQSSSKAPETPAEPTPPAPEPVEIVFCVNIQPQLPLEFWQSIADKYMAANNNVTVKIIGQPSSTVDVYQYEKTLLATNQFPDVMVMQNPADFVPSGALLAFDEGELDYIADPSIGKIGGKQYVANYKKQVIGVFYNKKIFADNGLEVPKTYQQFIDICETLKSKSILPVSMGIKDGWPQIMLANMIAGTDLLAKYPNWGADRNKDTVKFNNPDLVKAMQKYQDICTKYSGDSINSVTYTQMLEQFFTGEAGMLPMGSWVNAEVAKGTQDFEVGWFPMPGDNDANVLSVFVNEGISIGATDNNKNPDICKDFVRYFFTDKDLYGMFLESEQLFATTKETVNYNMIPLRKAIEQDIVGMKEVEGFESMTGDAAFLPGLKDFYTGKLTTAISMGEDVTKQLEAMDAEWEIANRNLAG